jgi:hypothetical protein
MICRSLVQKILMSASLIGSLGCQKSKVVGQAPDGGQPIAPETAQQSQQAPQSIAAADCDAHVFYRNHLAKLQASLSESGAKNLGTHGLTLAPKLDLRALDQSADCNQIDPSKILRLGASVNIDVTDRALFDLKFSKMKKVDFGGVSVTLDLNHMGTSQFVSLVRANPVKALSAYTGGVLTPRDLEDLAPLVNLADPLKIGQSRAYRFDKTSNQIIAEKSYSAPAAHATGRLTMQGLELVVNADDPVSFKRFEYYWFVESLIVDRLGTDSTETSEEANQLFRRFLSALSKNL